ncbi:MAG: hypothetical protein ACREDY_21895, partial [Bradyrhizobium sp.]
LYAGLSGREYPADDLGLGHGRRLFRLNMDGRCAMRLRCKHAAMLAAASVVVLFATDAKALMLTPFRYEHDARRHCPADMVVWLDFKKRKYYLGTQKLHGRGFHGSYVCLQEARRSLYRRSLLGLR